MNEEILKAIKEVVGDTVDEKINGKLIGIKAQLNAQDITLGEVKGLLEDKKFLVQLWTVIKFIGGVLVSLGSAILLYRKI